MPQPPAGPAPGASIAEPATAPPASPSPRAIAARHALLGALLLGVLADQLLRDHPWGLGLLAWITVLATVVLAIAQRDGRRLSVESRAWLAAAVLFAAGLSWHDSELLLGFDVLAMLTSLTLLALSLNAIPVAGLAVARVRDLLGAAIGTGISVATGVAPLLLRDAELHAALQTTHEGSARRVARALAITAPILLLFTVLLTQADPVFGSFLSFMEVDLRELLSHVALAGFFAWVVAGWLRRSFFAPHGAGLPDIAFPLRLGTTDVTFVLGALNVLFAAFVAVQVGWLFGGEALVLRTTGLGYAQYARRGFFELTAVAGLLLPVLLGAHALIPAPDERAHRLHRRLALPLVALLGAMMLSAGARMRLYVQYYGLSADRLYATAVMAWLAIVFAWLVLTVLRSRPRTFAMGLVTSGLGVLLVLNVLDPDALVARSNLARGEGGRTGAAGPDPRYLATLGGDAIPVLVAALTAPAAPADSAAAAGRCAAARIVLHRWTGERRERMGAGWSQWNLARSTATRAVLARQAQLRQLACPASPASPIARPASP